MAELVAENIRELVGEAPIILEIGCNDGTDTMRFLAAMPGARIYCFEPDPRAIARFHTIVNDERAELYETALSCTDGTAVFYGSAGVPPETSRRSGAPHYCFLPEWDLSGSLQTPTGHLMRSPWVTFPSERQCTVQTMRLDTWLDRHAEITGIGFIWLDVQGAEAMVIQGAPAALSVTRFLYTEYSDTPLYEGQVPLIELQRLLPGFELLSVHGENALFKNREL